MDKVARGFNLDLSLPWSSAKVLSFCLAGSTMWRAATIRQYVSRVNTIQKMMGLEEMVSSPWARRVLVGLSNVEKELPTRLAVTPPWMRIIRKQLCKAPWPREKKRLFWAVATLLFSGSLRSSEVLPDGVKQFRPDSTLLGSDVDIRQEKVNGKWVTFMLLKIRSPKEIKATSRKTVLVDVFEQSGPGSWFCPVKAWRKYKLVVRKGCVKPDMPAFRTKLGAGYTADAFNKDLKALLEENRIYKDGPGITSHSFRAGVASTLARLGFSEETISAQGRWSSACYNR